ncbi:SOS response-associated peptidase [Plantactinospora sp. GCM10030261]|uniref:SOS response-associated peptidase n=1 Tax=Plantactinospora sp. GCM10030261 TaxID=3273420 RepID=UPI0036121D93
MCGRYATTRGATELGALFDADDDTGGGLVADYNVAPTDRVPIVRLPRSGGRLLSTARWGLVPHWARDTRGAARMINARAETVATSNAFARSFAGRRCLVPADGWYEWVRREDGGKQPYYLTPRDGSVLAFAGVWSLWSDRTAAGAEPAADLLTCSIVTMAAAGDLADVHDRMPLMLPPERWPGWLAGGGDAAALLAPPSAEAIAGIEIRPVGRAVGDVRNDGPELVRRVAAPPPRTAPEEPVPLPLF